VLSPVISSSHSASTCWLHLELVKTTSTISHCQ
jgi:hypothetical protein